jgi:adenylate cyclase
MPRINLRSKLLLFSVVIAMLPLIVAGQSLIRIAHDEMKSAANDQLITAAREVTAGIENLFTNAWMAPLLLLRNAINEESLGIQEKISLLTRGILDLPDIVTLQVTIEGAARPLIISKDAYAARLREASLDPLTALRMPMEVVAEASERSVERVTRVDYVPEIDGWLATVILPMRSPAPGTRAALSARIDLARLRGYVDNHPLQRTGRITIVDHEGRQVLEKNRSDLRDRSVIALGLTLISGSAPIISVDRYTSPNGIAMLGAFSFPRSFNWLVVVEKSERDAYFAVGEMIVSLGIWLAAGLAAAAIGAVFFAYRISRPILEIGQAAIEVGKGNFRARVSRVRSRDEIGDLAERINTMIGQLNERFQLSKFVSGGTIAAIQKSDHEGVKLGGERREVAIMFADIRGYTAFAESRDPETVVDVLNHYFQRLADIVARNHGDIDKFVGDQIMAIFVSDRMVENAVACCLDVQDVMAALRRDHPERALELGIGVDVGEVVMGAMGSSQRMDYTVLGDHVNLAARLCSHALPGQTMVSESVYERAKSSPAFVFQPLDPIQVKGKSAPLNVFAAHRATTAAG